MQSVTRVSTASAVKNPFLGTTMTYRVAAAPTPSTTAFRQVTTMAKKKGKTPKPVIHLTKRSSRVPVLKSTYLVANFRYPHHCDPGVH